MRANVKLITAVVVAIAVAVSYPSVAQELTVLGRVSYVEIVKYQGSYVETQLGISVGQIAPLIVRCHADLTSSLSNCISPGAFLPCGNPTVTTIYELTDPKLSKNRYECPYRRGECIEVSAKLRLLSIFDFTSFDGSLPRDVQLLAPEAAEIFYSSGC